MAQNPHTLNNQWFNAAQTLATCHPVYNAHDCVWWVQPAQKPLHYSHPLQSRSLSVPATAMVQSFLPHSERTSYDGNSTRADSSAVINETTMGQVLCEVSHGSKEYKKPVKNVRMHTVKTINQSLHTINWIMSSCICNSPAKSWCAINWGVSRSTGTVLADSLLEPSSTHRYYWK